MKALDERQAKLASDYYGLACRVASIAVRKIAPRAEDESSGLASLALCEAAASWKGAGNFASFAACVIRRRVYDWARDEGYLGNPRYLRRWQSRRRPMAAVGVDPEDGRDTFAAVEAADMLNRLPAREATALRVFYLEGRTDRDVGATLGMSQSNAHLVRQSALSRLKESLAARGVG